MRRTGIVLFLALAALALPAFVAARRATRVDHRPDQQTVSDLILGRWDLTVQGTDAPYSSWLEVVAAKEPGKYHGRFVGRFGSARPVAQLEYREGKLDFTLPPQYEKMTKNLVFNGRLAANKLEGTTEGEDGKQLTWNGTRAPDLLPPKHISWGKSVTLFNGRDIRGWKLRSEKGDGCWTAENGTLTNNVPCVDLITNDQFKDFKLHLEFKLAEKSNSGVYLRGRHEVQIVDDQGAAPDNHGMGGLYGFLRPRINAGRAAGEWQTYDVTLIGRFVTVTLNGETVLGGQEIPGITGGALDSDEGTPGPLMLQGDHGKVWFRNITLTPAK